MKSQSVCGVLSVVLRNCSPNVTIRRSQTLIRESRADQRSRKRKRPSNAETRDSYLTYFKCRGIYGRRFQIAGVTRKVCVSRRGNVICPVRKHEPNSPNCVNDVSISQRRRSIYNMCFCANCRLGRNVW